MKIYLYTAFISILSMGVAVSQTLPNIQKNSLRAPANIKIDGNATEWNNKFQAYNHATDVYYTIANDDENLYFVLQATNPEVLTKITNRGVKIAINTLDKRSEENAPSIVFPVFELQYGNKPYIRFSIMGQLASQRKAAELNPDSVSKISNKKLHSNEKFIRTNNLPGVDTLLSIYNNKGIKVGESFDSKMVYTYELAIPLQYLGFSTSKPAKFAYHLSLPGLSVEKDFGMSVKKNERGQDVISFAAPETVKGEYLPAITSTTDFWGDYTLAVLQNN